MSDKSELLVDPEKIDPKAVFASGGAEVLLAEIEAIARNFVGDLSTATGRNVFKAQAYKIARTKVALDNIGKEHVADLKEKAKAVDAERKVLRDRLDALADEVRAPLTAYENAEKQRIDDHLAALAELEQATSFETAEPPAAEIQDRLDRIASMGGNRDWQEFAGRAQAARDKAMDTLTAMLNAAKRREAERAELEELRKKAAEREERERIANAAKLASEAAIKEAEERAAAERAKAQRQIEEANTLLERAAKEKAEYDRIAAAQAEEKRAADARAADRAHRAAIHATARDALMAATAAELMGDGLSDAQACAVVKVIVRGEIPNISITY